MCQRAPGAALKHLRKRLRWALRPDVNPEMMSPPELTVMSGKGG